MGSEIVLKSEVAQRLLPAGYKGKINLQELATQVHEASNLGNQSLTKLKEVTSGGYLKQTWNAKDINACVRDSLEAISTLSKAQIALQAITADLSQDTLHEQKQIYQQQQRLESQQETLASHSHKIEELVRKSNSADLIESIADEIDVIRKQISSLDQDGIKSWQQRQEGDIRGLHKSLSDALSEWVEKFASQIAEGQSSLRKVEARATEQYEALHQTSETIRTDVTGLTNTTHELNADIRKVEARATEQYEALHQTSETIRTDVTGLTNTTHELNADIRKVEARATEQYEALHQLHQRRIKQMVISMTVLALSQFGLVGYLAFRFG